MVTEDRLADRLEELLEQGLRGRDWPRELEALPPEERAEFEPALRALASLAEVKRPGMTLSAWERGRKRMLQSLRAGRAPQGRSAAGGRAAWLPGRWSGRLVPAALGVILLLLAGSGTVAAAQGALPGEPLYPVKLLSEQVQLWVREQVEGPAAALELADGLQRRRLNEAAAVAAQGRPAMTTVILELEAVGEGTVVAGGREMPLAPGVAQPPVSAGQRLRLVIETGPDGGLVVVEMEPVGGPPAQPPIRGPQLPAGPPVPPGTTERLPTLPDEEEEEEGAGHAGQPSEVVRPEPERIPFPQRPTGTDGRGSGSEGVAPRTDGGTDAAAGPGYRLPWLRGWLPTRQPATPGPPELDLPYGR